MTTNNDSQNETEKENSTTNNTRVPWYKKDRTIQGALQIYTRFKTFSSLMINEEKWKPYQAELFIIPGFTFSFVSLWSLLSRKMEPLKFRTIVTRSLLVTAVIEGIAIPRHLRMQQWSEQQAKNKNNNNNNNNGNGDV